MMSKNGYQKKKGNDSKKNFSVKKSWEPKKEAFYKGRIMILKSYGFDEKIAKELCLKHNGNLFHVLNEYQTLMKQSNIKIKSFDEEPVEKVIINDIIVENIVLEKKKMIKLLIISLLKTSIRLMKLLLKKIKKN